jgi:hypothetical protein
MEGIHHRLDELCERVQRQLKAKLSMQIGGLVRQYLPQTWVFETELGACSVHIDVEGNVRVNHGPERERDITLIWNYKALERVLQSDSLSSMRPEDYPKILVETEKGRAAFNYLKKEFKL